MKFQKTPLILLFSASLLGGFVYFSELRKEHQPAAKTDSKSIFALKEDDIQAFTIQTPKQTLKFEQIPMTIPSGQAGLKKTSSWQMIAPQRTTADEATVAFLLNLIATATSDRSLPTPATRKAEFGLEPPFATIEAKTSNQTHRLILGKPNFNRQFLYALADPVENSAQDLAVLQVSIEFQNALDRPLSDWKQVKEKPKPSPSSSASPVPTTSPSGSSNSTPKAPQ